MEEKTEDNKINMDLSRREVLAKGAHVFVAGVAVLALGELPLLASNGNGKESLSVRNYVRSKMARTSIDNIRSETNVSNLTFYALQKAEIKTALDLEHYEPTPENEFVEWKYINEWYEFLEDKYTQDFYQSIPFHSLSSTGYIRFRMSEISFGILLLTGGIGIPTLKYLREANIETLANYNPAIDLGLSELEAKIFRKIYDAFKLKFEREYQGSNILSIAHVATLVGDEILRNRQSFA